MKLKTRGQGKHDSTVSSASSGKYNADNVPLSGARGIQQGWEVGVLQGAVH